MKYQLVVDTWEAGGEIDEAVYKENGIAAIIVRLNDMNGGHHVDEGFVKQWAEAKSFLRAPYFVYNPWKDAQGNFDWLIANCPDDANTVLVDIEVSKSDYSRNAYATQVSAFMDMVEEHWGTKTIYTGEWFLEILDFWPTDAEYWWAQYPYAFYPKIKTYMTWGDVGRIIEENQYRAPFNIDKVPGEYCMWQFTGDRIVCPGNAKPIDISIFPGSYDELVEFLGYAETEPPTPTPPIEGDDMRDAILELARQTGRIADALETGAASPPPSTTPPAPVSGYPKRWQLINHQPNGSVPFFRNNDVNDNKITVWGDNTVLESLPPNKYWDNEADLKNILREWAWIPSCVTYNAGGKAMMMPRNYKTTTDKSTDNWFGGGFVQRARLRAA